MSNPLGVPDELAATDAFKVGYATQEVTAILRRCGCYIDNDTRDRLARVRAVLTYAQEVSAPGHRAPCVAGERCGEAAHCPPEDGMSAASRYSFADLYDADKRTTDPRVESLAAALPIPHPLRNVQYADGISRCTHAKRHVRFEVCPGPTI